MCRTVKKKKKKTTAAEEKNMKMGVYADVFISLRMRALCDCCVCARVDRGKKTTKRASELFEFLSACEETKMYFSMVCVSGLSFFIYIREKKTASYLKEDSM